MLFISQLQLKLVTDTPSQIDRHDTGILTTQKETCTILDRRLLWPVSKKEDENRLDYALALQNGVMTPCILRRNTKRW